MKDVQVAEKRGLRGLVPAVVTTAMVASGSAMANDPSSTDTALASLANGAKTTITNGLESLGVVGLAVIGVAAFIYVILRVKGLIR